MRERADAVQPAPMRAAAGWFADARARRGYMIALTILKAFVIDMSTLTGAYRALSFMGLGIVLVAIGWLYQRILFRRQPPPVTQT